jgi:hypothetical protein
MNDLGPGLQTERVDWVAVFNGSLVAAPVEEAADGLARRHLQRDLKRTRDW